MADPSSTDASAVKSRKRALLNRESDDEQEQASAPQIADEATMATRRIIRVKRDSYAGEPVPDMKGAFSSLVDPAPKGDVVSPFNAPSAAASVFSGGFSFGSAPSASAAEPTKPSVFGGGFSFGAQPKADAVASSGPSASATPTTAQTSAAVPNVFGNGFSFAATPAPPLAKAFGAGASFGALSFGAAAAAKTGEDEGEDDPEAEVPLPAAGTRPLEPTLAAVAVDNGESGESTVFSGELRLSAFHDNEWKERGSGTLRLNVKETTTGGVPVRRLIMRSSQTKQLLLCAVLDARFSLSAKATDKALIFVVLEVPKGAKGDAATEVPVTYCLRAAKGAVDTSKAITELTGLIKSALAVLPH